MDSEIIASFVGGVFTLVAAMVIYWLSKKYSDHTKDIENSKTIKELFTEFNKRFDKINNDLDWISRLPISEETWDLKIPEHRQYYGVVIDFFNICSEEYYWNQKGRLDDKIWHSWEIGMNIIYNRSSLIQLIWDEECKIGC